MIEGEFEASEGAKAVGFSHGDFGFVIQALNDAAGEELLGAEIIENQLSVLTQRPVNTSGLAVEPFLQPHGTMLPRALPLGLLILTLVSALMLLTRSASPEGRPVCPRAHLWATPLMSRIVSHITVDAAGAAGRTIRSSRSTRR